MQIINGDCLTELKKLPDESVNCCVTSPPYWGLRDYGVDGQIGLEKTPDEYVEKLVNVFREVKRVLKNDGTVWLNLGDTYSAHKDCKSVPDSLRVGGRSEPANVIEKGQSHSRNSRALKSVGLKNKDLIGIPWRVAFALQKDGWYLRSDIIWHKPNPMPESVTDRPTKSHEYIFLLAKSQKYYFDNEAVKEPSCTFENRPDGIVRDRIYDYDSKQKQLRTHRIGEKQTFGGRKARENKIDETDPRFRNGSEQWGRELILKENRNIRSVWTVTTKPFKEAHFATFPEKLIIPCIKAGCPKGGVVLDPFGGSGTTGVVAEKLGRDYILIELNPNYIEMADNRTWNVAPLFRRFNDTSIPGAD